MKHTKFFRVKKLGLNIPFLTRFVHISESWETVNAINQMDVHCELVEFLEYKINTSSGSKKASYCDAAALISSYSFEIAMKSFWALDNPHHNVPRTHKLTKLLKGLNKDTKKELESIGINSKFLQKLPAPFIFNRYSMEKDKGVIIVTYPSRHLQTLIVTLRKIHSKRQDELLSPY